MIRSLLFTVAILTTSLTHAAGHYLLLGAENRLVVTNPAGDVVWQMPWGSIHDVHVTDRDTILTIRGRTEVVEIDPRTKQVVWSYDAAEDGQPIEIHSVSPVENGNVMIALSGAAKIIEVDRDGKLVHSMPLTVDHPSTHGDTRLVRPIADGGYLVAHEADAKVRQYDADGNVDWSFDVPLFGQSTREGHGPEAYGNRLFSVTPDSGDYWIGTGNGHGVLRVDSQKQIRWQIQQNDLENIRLAWVTTVIPLPSGNLLIGNCHAGPDQPLVIEVDPKSKSVVWQLNGHDRFGNNVSNSTIVDDPSLFGIAEGDDS